MTVSTQSTRALFNFLVFAALLVPYVRCTKPSWYADFKQLLDNCNHEFKIVLPELSESSTPERVYKGLNRLDHSLDGMILNLRNSLEAHPDVFKSRAQLTIYLQGEARELMAHVKQLFGSMARWHKKLKNDSRFIKPAISITRKGDAAKALMQKYDTYDDITE